MTDDCLRVATWNIHDAVGWGGKRDLARVGRVIASLRAPIVGLQEVACGGGDACDIAVLSRATGLGWRAIPTRGHRDLQLGNALLTSLPIDDVQIHDLSVADREPRAALEVAVMWGRHRIRVVVTHLGLRAGERRRQVQRLLASVGDTGTGTDATILLGDINEWFIWGRPLRWLHRKFGAPPAVGTFPSRLPILALDRVWAHPRRALTSVASAGMGEAQRASDHLPVVATLRLSNGAQREGEPSSDS